MLMYERLLDKSVIPDEVTMDLWKNRYPCGECGGWVHFRILTDDELIDVIKLLAIKKKPSAK